VDRTLLEGRWYEGVLRLSFLLMILLRAFATLRLLTIWTRFHCRTSARLEATAAEEELRHSFLQASLPLVMAVSSRHTLSVPLPGLLADGEELQVAKTACPCPNTVGEQAETSVKLMDVEGLRLRLRVLLGASVVGLL
jgi:hypothetical protein